jgi:DNA-directed RNA polymerase subunit RPC12/RpoP
MPVIVLHFDDFKAEIDARPERCPYCSGQIFQRWGSGAKPVQDADPEIGEYVRYHCTTCGRTFRHYPPGIDKTRLTQRVRTTAGIAWALGLSAREVVEVFADLGIELSYMTVWRNGNDLVTKYQDSFGPNHPGRYSIDKLFLNNHGRGIGTSIMVDLGNGKTIALGRMDVVDYRKILAWLEPILKGLNIHVSTMGTDALFGLHHT